MFCFAKVTIVVNSDKPMEVKLYYDNHNTEYSFDEEHSKIRVTFEAKGNTKIKFMIPADSMDKFQLLLSSKDATITLDDFSVTHGFRTYHLNTNSLEGNFSSTENCVFSELIRNNQIQVNGDYARLFIMDTTNQLSTGISIWRIIMLVFIGGGVGVYFLRTRKKKLLNKINERIKCMLSKVFLPVFYGGLILIIGLLAILIHLPLASCLFYSSILVSTFLILVLKKSDSPLNGFIWIPVSFFSADLL